MLSSLGKKKNSQDAAIAGSVLGVNKFVSNKAK